MNPAIIIMHSLLFGTEKRFYARQMGANIMSSTDLSGNAVQCCKSVMKTGVLIMELLSWMSGAIKHNGNMCRGWAS